MSDFYEAWFDGSSKSDLQLSGIGGLIKQNDKLIFEYSKEVPYTDCIYMLEYQALHQVMKELLSMGAKNVIIKGDSKWVIERIIRTDKKSRFKLQDYPGLLEIHQQCVSLFDEFRYCSIIWIPRELNEEAHLLCNEATRGVTNV